MDLTDWEDGTETAPAPSLNKKPVVFSDIGTEDEDLAGIGITAPRTVPILVKPWMKHHTFRVVESLEEVRSIVDAALASGTCALDLETTGLDTRLRVENGVQTTYDKIVGFCLSFGDAKAGYYIPVRHESLDGGPDKNVRPVEAVEAEIARLCLASQPVPAPDEPNPLSFQAKPPMVIRFWNAKFDQEMLLPITGLDWWHPDSFEDGLLIAFAIYTNGELGLKANAKGKLRDLEGNPYEMIELKELFPLKGRKIAFQRLSPDEPSVAYYACADAICTQLLVDHPDMLPKVRSFTYKTLQGVEYPSAKPYLWAYRLEKQVTQVVRAMERAQILVNPEKMLGVEIATKARLEEIVRELTDLAKQYNLPEFNPASSQHVGQLLFGSDYMNLEPKPDRDNPNDPYPTNAETLENLTREMEDRTPPAIGMVLEFRKKSKLLNTYLRNMDLQAAVGSKQQYRVVFNQTGADTARFTVPVEKKIPGTIPLPMHGIPKKGDMRSCFEARPGYLLIKSDYSGQELRVLTNLSGEEKWIREYREGTGDLHSVTARTFDPNYDTLPKDQKDELRKGAKAANFSSAYGGGAPAIQRATGCSNEEARRRKANMTAGLAQLADWSENQKVDVKKRLGIYNPFGRWIAIPDANIKAGQSRAPSRESGGTAVVVPTEEMAKKIRSKCDRNSLNAPIQSAGADIIKIAMVRLFRNLYVKGWLNTRNGDDSVRILLTVHDELVIEVRFDRFQDVMDMVKEAMEFPACLPKPPYSAPWLIPLEIETLIGPDWGAETKCMPVKGPVKPGQVRYGNWVLDQPIPWLIENLGSPSEQINQLVVSPQAVVEDVPTSSPAPAAELPPSPALPAPPTPQAVQPSIPAPVSAPRLPPEKKQPLVTFALNRLTTKTLDDLFQVLLVHVGTYRVRVICAHTGKVVVDPSLNLFVNPTTAHQELYRLNLTSVSATVDE